MKAEHRLKSRNIKTLMFREPDIGDQATALSTEPINGSTRKFMSRYPLWKGDKV